MSKSSHVCLTIGNARLQSEWWITTSHWVVTSLICFRLSEDLGPWKVLCFLYDRSTCHSDYIIAEVIHDRYVDYIIGSRTSIQTCCSMEDVVL